MANVVNEKNTATLRISFLVGTTAVQPTAATYSLFDADTGTIINSRSDVAFVPTGSTHDLALTEDDNALVSQDNHYETHCVEVHWTFTTNRGKQRFYFRVVNLAKTT